MSTMKAHTRLDLKTSSLIWEYCKVSRGLGGREEEGDDVREGRRKTFSGRRRGADASDTHRGADTTPCNGLTTSVSKRERDRSLRAGRRAAGWTLASVMLTASWLGLEENHGHFFRFEKRSDHRSTCSTGT